MQLKKDAARVGLYTAGLRAYWDQFLGLHDRILGYNHFIEQKVSQWAEVFDFGLVDDEQKAREAGEYFNAHNVDLILMHSGTYFTSAAMLPVHQICKAPVVVLNLQPAVQMNYERTDTGEWLAQCVGCPVPEAANAFERAGITVRIVNGLLGLEQTPQGAMADRRRLPRRLPSVRGRRSSSGCALPGSSGCCNMRASASLETTTAECWIFTATSPCFRRSWVSMWSCWKCATSTAVCVRSRTRRFRRSWTKFMHF